MKHPVNDPMIRDTNLHCAALVGSRICHDLISPIGAIANGMELLAMTGTGDSPEMALIRDSVAAANARIRFFRIAYGDANPAQVMGRSEVTAILRDITQGSRLGIRWTPEQDVPRPQVQLAFLAIQCAEQALPYGGQINITRDAQGIWSLELAAERISVDPALWAHLSPDAAQVAACDLMPAHVQFMLLPQQAAACGRSVSTQQGAHQAVIRF